MEEGKHTESAEERRQEPTRRTNGEVGERIEMASGGERQGQRSVKELDETCGYLNECVICARALAD